MTTLAITDRIRKDALAVDPVKVVLFVLLLPFMVLGWSVRLVGYVLAFAWIAARAGYSDAGGWLAERERRRAAD
jgi:hypothetical protein